VASEQDGTAGIRRWEVDAGVVIPIWGQASQFWVKGSRGLFTALAGPGYDVRATYRLSNGVRMGFGAEYVVLNAKDRDAFFPGQLPVEGQSAWTNWLAGFLLVELGTDPEDGGTGLFMPLQLIYGGHVGSWFPGDGYGIASGVGIRRMSRRVMWTAILHVEATLGGCPPSAIEGWEIQPGQFFVWMLTARLFTGVRL